MSVLDNVARAHVGAGLRSAWTVLCWATRVLEPQSHRATPMASSWHGQYPPKRLLQFTDNRNTTRHMLTRGVFDSGNRPMGNANTGDANDRNIQSSSC